MSTEQTPPGSGPAEPATGSSAHSETAQTAAEPTITDPPPDPAAVPPVPQASPWNVANLLTVVRIALVPVFCWLLFRSGGHQTMPRLLATGVFVLASVTDKIDGDIARRRNLVTNFGKVADPIADKALMGAAFISLSLLGEVWWWVTILVLARELVVTLLRFWVIRHGVIPASRGGKLKTMLQSIALTLYLLPYEGVLKYPAAIVMGAAVVVTVATGVDYVFRAIKMKQEPYRAK